MLVAQRAKRTQAWRGQRATYHAQTIACKQGSYSTLSLLGIYEANFADTTFGEMKKGCRRFPRLHSASRMKLPHVLAAIAGMLVCASSFTAAENPPSKPASAAAKPASIQRFGPSPAGTAQAVRVDDSPLLFTGQIVATDLAGTPAQQAAGAIAALSGLLDRSGSDVARIVRLTAYATDSAAATAAQQLVAQRFKASPPAFTLIRTPLATPGARVAFEAVALASPDARATSRSATAAILPPGGKVFISGQAEKASDLTTGAKLTVAGLHRTLAHLGLGKENVVQVKAFIRPMEEAAAAERAIAASFEGRPPPVVLVAWKGDPFTEIELVAADRAAPPAGSDAMSFARLPWLNASPRFSHVVRIRAGTPLIFIGETSGDATPARSQLEATFTQLAHVLFLSGGSFRTLAKATYYLGDPDLRGPLGDIRGVYFDPARAPAASAVPVIAMPDPQSAFSLDLIATPASP